MRYHSAGQLPMSRNLDSLAAQLLMRAAAGTRSTGEPSAARAFWRETHRLGGTLPGGIHAPPPSSRTISLSLFVCVLLLTIA